jgi:hypothetical protein
MPTTITHNFIDSTVGGDFMDSLEVSHETEISERRGTDGNFKKVKDFNPTNGISFKGGGAPATALGSASLTIAELTGGVTMLSKFVHTQHNNDFDEYASDGKHYPNATVAS